MAALAEQSGIDLRWVAGSLGLHEECAHTIADPIVRFLDASASARLGFYADARGSGGPCSRQPDHLMIQYIIWISGAHPMFPQGFCANAQKELSLSTTVAFVKPAAPSSSVNPWFCCPA